VLIAREFTDRFLESESELNPAYLAYALFRRRFERHEGIWHLDEIFAPAWGPNQIGWRMNYQIEGRPMDRFSHSLPPSDFGLLDLLVQTGLVA
jgi:hypothetical protein